MLLALLLAWFLPLTLSVVGMALRAVAGVPGRRAVAAAVAFWSAVGQMPVGVDSFAPPPTRYGMHRLTMRDGLGVPGVVTPAAGRSWPEVVTVTVNISMIDPARPGVASALHAERGGEGYAPWSSRHGQWCCIVDSGAELNIAGGVIYKNSEIIELKLDVRVRGVDGHETQVDAVVRAIATLPDGEHCIHEFLVCNDFDLALWGTPYMSEFGYGHWLVGAKEESYIVLPSGTRAPVLPSPYRIRCPMRKPTAAEIASPPPPPSVAVDTGLGYGRPGGELTVAPATQPASVAARDRLRFPPTAPALVSDVGVVALTEDMRLQLLAEAYDGLSWCDEGSAHGVRRFHGTDTGPTMCDALAVLVGSSLVPALAAAPRGRRCSEAEAWRYHRCHMHRDFDGLASDLGLTFPPMPKCDVCNKNRAVRKPYPSKGDMTVTAAGQLSHCDTWGPFADALYYDGCRYVHLFSDEYSDVSLAVFCEDRTTTTWLSSTRLWVAFLRSLGVGYVAAILTDGAPEFVSKEAFDFCDEHSLQRVLSVRYCLQLDGKAERKFGVHISRARCAINGGMSEYPHRIRLYALAIQQSLCLHNRTPSKRLGGKRPFDLVPAPPRDDLHRAPPMFCKAWARQPDVHVDTKMDPIARSGVFAGMSEIYKGFTIFYPDTCAFEAAYHSTFDPDDFPYAGPTGTPPPGAPPAISELPPVHEAEPLRTETTQYIPPPEGFLAARWERLIGLDEDNFDTMPLCKRKRGKDNLVTGHKVRVVLCGNQVVASAKKGLSKTTVDMRTHSPAIRALSLKCGFAVGVLDDLRQRDFDVEAAYLQGVYVDRRVLCCAPVILRKYDERGVEYVWLLKRALYGGPDSGRLWYNTYAHYMMHEEKVMPFQRCHYDPCAFTHFVDGSTAPNCAPTRIIAMVYVDDGRTWDNCAAVCDGFYSRLQERFAITISGAGLTFMIGMDISMGEGWLTITSSTYIRSMEHVRALA